MQQYHRGLGKNFYPHSRMGIDSWPMRCWITWRNFYPRSRMGSDQVCNPACGLQHISIHAPAWGATGEIFNACGDAGKFLSTLPHGERQMALRGGFKTAQISIYAPAWGATECAGDGYGRYRHFYPRPPHGERLMMRNLHPSADEISIHAPAWGATPECGPAGGPDPISIHAPAWGATNSIKYANPFQ